MKHCNIPNSWTGSEALAFVALLDRLRDAIWRAHGREMARCLWRQRYRRHHRLATRPPLILYDNMPGIDRRQQDPAPQEAR
jgi:hypothetical protein